MEQVDSETFATSIAPATAAASSDSDIDASFSSLPLIVVSKNALFVTGNHRNRKTNRKKRTRFDPCHNPMSNADKIARNSKTLIRQYDGASIAASIAAVTAADIATSGGARGVVDSNLKTPAVKKTAASDISQADRIDNISTSDCEKEEEEEEEEEDKVTGRNLSLGCPLHPQQRNQRRAGISGSDEMAGNSESRISEEEEEEEERGKENFLFHHHHRLLLLSPGSTTTTTTFRRIKSENDNDNNLGNCKKVDGEKEENGTAERGKTAGMTPGNTGTGGPAEKPGPAEKAFRRHQIVKMGTLFKGGRKMSPFGQSQSHVDDLTCSGFARSGLTCPECSAQPGDERRISHSPINSPASSFSFSSFISSKSSTLILPNVQIPSNVSGNDIQQCTV